MPKPWGLSGPEFLQLYWIGLVLAAIVAIVVRVRVRAGNNQPVRSLDVDELAFLAGGPRRVVETALARLLTAGELRTSRRGTVQATTSTQSVNPVDRVVITDSQRYTNRTVTLLIPAVAKDDVVTGIGRRLEDMGLVVNPDVAKTTLRKGSIALWVLLAIGVARWVNGIANGADVGWLTLQIAITPVLIFLVTRRGKLLRTAKGDRVLDTARASGTAGGKATSSDDLGYAGIAGLVAFGGLTVYPDLAVRSSLLAAPVAPSWTGGTNNSSGYACSGAGSSSCSSGSSCGGGGGCGGGCGGGS